MKNLLEHYKARIRFLEGELNQKNFPISKKIKRETQLDCYITFVKELEKLIK